MMASIPADPPSPFSSQPIAIVKLRRPLEPFAGEIAKKHRFHNIPLTTYLTGRCVTMSGH